jgi:Fe-S cluster assembly protein SufD
VNAQARPAAQAESFLSRYEGLKTRLPGAAAARADAAAELRRTGLPDRQDEAWKYTSLRSLAEIGFHEALTVAGDNAAAIPLPPLGALADLPRLVFAGGRFRDDLSIMPSAFAPHVFADAPQFTLPIGNDTIVTLNTLLAEDGAIITIPAGLDAGTLVLVHLGADLNGTPAAFHPRHSITLGAGAKLTLVEISAGHGAYLHNPVMEIALAESATLAHLRLQAESLEAFHLGAVHARIAAAASYDGFTLTMGGKLVRSEIHAHLEGANGHAALNAAQILRGRQHADFTTVVSHDAPSCASRQTVKNVLTDHARGVFQGKIEVARIAQKTDGYQMNQALLLSPDAEIDSKPQLEIYADDVKCSHGATVGELDADQLFYLTSRGIPLAEARGMLVRAFLTEALDLVTHEAARALFEDALTAWWRQQDAS